MVRSCLRARFEILLDSEEVLSLTMKLRGSIGRLQRATSFSESNIHRLASIESLAWKPIFAYGQDPDHTAD